MKTESLKNVLATLLAVAAIIGTAALLVINFLMPIAK
jgi:hypothetical protein